MAERDARQAAVQTLSSHGTWSYSKVVWKKCANRLFSLLPWKSTQRENKKPLCVCQILEINAHALVLMVTVLHAVVLSL